MKASELRIGNYIEFYNHIQPKRTVKVNARLFSSLAGGRSMDEVKDDEEFNEYYSGIPLTPEILEKCGLSNHKRSVSFADSGFDPNVFWYFLDGTDEHNQRVYRYGFILGQFKDLFFYQAGNRRTKGIRITHLHQLQNLYFALTGEELNYTP